MEKWIWEATAFAAFVLICAALLRPKFSPAKSFAIGGCAFLCIILLNVVPVLSGVDGELVLTCLVLTAYLPAVICLHVLSGSGFFQTAAVWTVGDAACFTLDVLRKLLLQRGADEITVTLTLLLAAMLMVAVAFSVLRKPFRGRALQSMAEWLPLCFPALMLMLLMSYFTDSTTNPTVLILLFMTSASVFALLARALINAAKVEELEAERRSALLQLEIERRQCEELGQRIKANRAYRHDMRHHLAVLEGLARREESSDILSYLEQLGGRLSEASERNWCANAAINAVLSAYLEDAQKAGCRVDADVRLPGELPFDELDVCVILANTLENAIHACEAEPEGARYIRLRTELIDGQKLIIEVDNPCRERPEADVDGLPASKSEGRGVGLRSVATAAERHHGLIKCSWKDGEFRFRAALFIRSGEAGGAAIAETPKRRWSAASAAAVASMALLAVLTVVNCMPALADALEDAPVLGMIVSAADGRTYGWGDTRYSEELPELTEEELEAQRERFVKEMESEFIWYAFRRYNGYVGMDVTSQVLRDDEEYLVIRFDGVLNAGGSGQYSRCITLDKGSGEILELGDLFAEGTDYVGVISEEILSQMTAAVEAGGADYFVPGGIWSDEECFESIDPNQNFYVDEDGDLVIIFEEYEVAPGSMGSPEFAIDRELLKDILLPSE